MTDLSKQGAVDYKISVIVPVYKVEKYLERCVDSIRNQTYKNLEIILVDDGSEDNCPEICDRYSRLDERIKVIHQKNAGLSAARNMGLKVATGEYIALVDSDDYINCNMFADMMEQLHLKKADIVMCDCKYVYDTDEDADVNEKASGAEVISVDGREAQYYAYRDDYNRIAYTVAWNKIYRRELFEGISYPVGRIHEDEARTHQLLYRANKIVYVKYPYYFYFQRKDSIVGKKISRANLQQLDAYADKLRFYMEKREYELWRMEASHSMHMVCYQQGLFEKDRIKISIRKEQSGNSLTNEIKKYKAIAGIPLVLRLEILLFIYFPRLYFKVWRFKKD